MKGITFGSYHSYDDFNLLLVSKEVGSPSVKVKEIDIPGADGSLDLTDFFGEAKYENVTHKFQFRTIVPQVQFLSLYSTIKNAIHGKKLRVVLDDDPSFYYVGRCFVSSWTNEKNIGIVAVECVCEPYKYRITAKSVNLCGKNLLNLDAAINTRPQYWTKTETGLSFDRGSATWNGYVYFEIPVIKGKTYTFSAAGTTFTGGTPSLYVYKDFVNREIIKRANLPSSVTFVALETTRYAFTLIANSTTVTANFVNVMVEEGSAATAFEAYDATEKTVEATFNNLRKTAIPNVYVTGNMTVKKGTTITTLSSGTNVLPEFAFQQGETALSFTGNGVAAVEWKEGCL